MSGKPPKVLDRLTLWQIDALGLGVCAVAALVWYFAGLQPLSEARAERVSLGGALAARAVEVERLQGVKRELEQSLAEVRRKLDSGCLQLSPLEHLNRRVADLTELAQGHGLRLDQIRPGAASPHPRFTKVPIRVSGGGTWTACAAFLRAVHERFPDVGVAAMDLRGEPEMPERGARFGFDLVWYAAPGGGTSKK